MGRCLVGLRDFLFFSPSSCPRPNGQVEGSRLQVYRYSFELVAQWCSAAAATRFLESRIDFDVLQAPGNLLKQTSRQ